MSKGNKLNLEGEQVKNTVSSFETESGNVDENYKCLEKEVREVRSKIKYPEIHDGTTVQSLSFHMDFIDLQDIKRKQRVIRDELYSLEEYFDNGSLYNGHLVYKSGADICMMDHPNLRSKYLENNVHLINTDDAKYQHFFEAWKYPDTDKEVRYSSNLTINGKKLKKVDVIYDGDDELYGEITDNYLKNALMQNKNKGEIESIIQTIQKKQNDIRNVDKSKSFAVQGCAGSGKTMVLLHRLRYLLFNKSFGKKDYYLLVPGSGLKSTIDEVASKFSIDKDNIRSYFEYFRIASGSVKNKVDESNELVFSRDYLSLVYSESFIRDCYEKFLSDISVQTDTLVAECEDIFNGRITAEEQDINDKIHTCMDYALKEAKRIADPFQSTLEMTVEEYSDIPLFSVKLVELYDNCIQAQKKSEEFNADAIEISPEDERIANNPRLAGLKQEIEIVKKNVEKATIFTVGSHRRKLKRLNEKYEETYNDIEKELIEHEIEMQKQAIAEKSYMPDGLTLEDVMTAISSLDKIWKESEKIIGEETSKKEEFEKYIEEKYSDEIAAINSLEDYYEIFINECGDKIKALLPMNTSLSEYVAKGSELFLLMLTHIDDEETKKKLASEFTLFNGRTTAMRSGYMQTKLFNTFRREVKSRTGKTINNIYKHYWFIYLYCCYLLNRIDDKKRSYFFIDEAQDLSCAELNLIYKINCGNNGDIPVFNLFGDTNQVISSHGIKAWSELKFIKNRCILDENFRNTNQIVDFCNEALDFKMKKVGVDMEAVMTFNSVQEYLKNNKLDGNVFIVKDEYAEADLKLIFASEGVTNSEIYTVKQSKGLEFKEVYVIDRDMTQNEKYIAYTRALCKLYVINDMDHYTDVSADLAVNGNESEESL